MLDKLKRILSMETDMRILGKKLRFLEEQVEELEIELNKVKQLNNRSSK